MANMPKINRVLATIVISRLFFAIGKAVIFFIKPPSKG
jgi:hypothetical protein